ncbi:hypothetical protein ALC53_08791 [Atta colombica]|uniref:Uncharacterized protein n=1 Tax=Atta colombica TaxID=520822 RepID=A0A195B983_9HYME|nr:hypothetical protein ALC53_08791 [Atta colombica]
MPAEATFISTLWKFQFRTGEKSRWIAKVKATEVQKRPRILARYVSLSFPFTLTEDIFDAVSIAKLVNDNDELITSFEFCHFLLGDFYEL